MRRNGLNPQGLFALHPRCGKIRADVDRRIIQKLPVRPRLNCVHYPFLVPALPAWELVKTFREVKMAKAPERPQRRHVREKATIDHLVQDVYKPKPADEKHPEHGPTTSSGLPVEDQVRKEWDPRKGGLPVF